VRGTNGFDKNPASSDGHALSAARVPRRPDGTARLQRPLADLRRRRRRPRPRTRRFGQGRRVRLQALRQVDREGARSRSLPERWPRAPPTSSKIDGKCPADRAGKTAKSSSPSRRGQLSVTLHRARTRASGMKGVLRFVSTAARFLANNELTIGGPMERKSSNQCKNATEQRPRRSSRRQPSRRSRLRARPHRLRSTPRRRRGHSSSTAKHQPRRMPGHFDRSNRSIFGKDRNGRARVGDSARPGHADHERESRASRAARSHAHRGTTKERRTDALQVTYNHHPLLHSSKDTKRGQTNGEGVNDSECLELRMFAGRSKRSISRGARPRWRLRKPAPTICGEVQPVVPIAGVTRWR